LRNFFTKTEACQALSTIEGKEKLGSKELNALESIRICLIGEMNGLSLWGKDIEKIRPIFKAAPDPEKYHLEELVKNYEAYLTALHAANMLARE
jgi:hypothetical protein